MIFAEVTREDGLMIDGDTVRTWDELNEAVRRRKEETGETYVMCSSSVDFPDEYTDDQEVIDLCIRWRRESA